MASKKVSKKKVVKKTSQKASPKKTVKKKAATKKTAGKSSAKKISKKAPAAKAIARKASVKKLSVRTKKLSGKESRELHNLLLVWRERISGEYTTLSRDNLSATSQRDPSLSDQGTDTFDREMELNMMGNEQEVLFEIDAALRRIENKTYGVCELTGDLINIERLRALPYVRYTVQAQSELERGRAHYRPFGGTIRG